VRNPEVPNGITATVSYVAVSSPSHEEWSRLTERPRGPVDVCPLRNDLPGDPRLANAMMFLAARYLPAT